MRKVAEGRDTKGRDRASAALVFAPFISTVGVACTVCCVKCGCTIGLDEKKRFINFDGMPHKCTPEQAITDAQRKGWAGPPRVSGPAQRTLL